MKSLNNIYEIPIPWKFVLIRISPISKYELSLFSQNDGGTKRIEKKYSYHLLRLLFGLEKQILNPSYYFLQNRVHVG